jgi:hypothetical protein
MNQWINEWMNEWMNQWMNEWMNEWMRRKRTTERVNEHKIIKSETKLLCVIFTKWIYAQVNEKSIKSRLRNIMALIQPENNPDLASSLLQRNNINQPLETNYDAINRYWIFGKSKELSANWQCRFFVLCILSSLNRTVQTVCDPNLFFLPFNSNSISPSTKYISLIDSQYW